MPVPNNQKRVLAQVLAIDAWHEPIKYDGTSASVHVELSFQDGRIGGDDPDFPFTFKVGLKRALLTITLEPPLCIDRSSVARNIPKDRGEWSRAIALRNNAEALAQFKGNVSPESVHVSMGGALKAETGITQEERMKVVQQLPRIIASPKPGGTGCYSWEMVPGYENLLLGQPWDPVEEPRLSVKSTEKVVGIDPAIKILISCSLEDIQISDLNLKSKSLTSRIDSVIFNKVNLAAAVQQLKLTLREMQLEFGSLDDAFSQMIIADMIASPK